MEVNKMKPKEVDIILDVALDLVRLAQNSGELSLCEDLLSVAMNHDERDVHQNIYQDIFGALSNQIEQLEVSEVGIHYFRNDLKLKQ